MAVDLRGELTVAPLGSTVVTKTLSAVGIESSVTKTAQVRGHLADVKLEGLSSCA